MKREALAELYKRYELTREDVFVQKLGGREIPTVTRTGVEKIQGKLGINLSYSLEHINEDASCVVVKCIGSSKKEGIVLIESYGEATPANCKQNYKVAMAEKRAKARVVLQIAGFYRQGVYEEVEFE